MSRICLYQQLSLCICRHAPRMSTICLQRELVAALLHESGYETLWRKEHSRYASFAERTLYYTTLSAYGNNMSIARASHFVGSRIRIEKGHVLIRLFCDPTTMCIGYSELVAALCHKPVAALCHEPVTALGYEPNSLMNTLQIEMVPPTPLHGHLRRD